MSFTAYLSAGELGDIEVEVEYDYTPGYRGSWNEPPCYPEAEITSVKWLGVEILKNLPEETVIRLVEDAFNDVTGEANQAMEDRAESRYFEREAA